MAGTSKRTMLREGSKRVLIRLSMLAVMEANITFASRVLQSGGGRGPNADGVRAAFTTLYGELNRRRMDAIRDALTFGLLVDDPQMKQEIGKEVLAWYGRERHAVMNLLTWDGERPNMYRSDTESDLRAEIRHALWDILKPEDLPAEWRADYERVENRSEEEAEQAGERAKDV